MSGRGNSRCHSPVRVCPGPDQLSGERKTRVREGLWPPVRTWPSALREEPWAAWSFHQGSKSVPLATALKTAEASLWRS